MKRKTLPALVLALALCLGLSAPASAYDMGKAGFGNTISASHGNSAVIDTDGSLWMWGLNINGQVGDGGEGHFALDPRKVLDNVVSVSCGYLTSAAIGADGSLWMWGDNSYGQLGNGGRGNAEAVTEEGSTIQTAPIQVMDGVTAVSCGWKYTAAIKTDGSLWMWGSNKMGQLGNGGGGNSTYEEETIQTTPVKIMDDVAAVSCGRDHAAAIKTDGSLWMWGNNGSSQLGNGFVGNSEVNNVPVQTVPFKLMDGVSAVSCGNGYTLALKTDGTVWAWGINLDGCLGNNGMGDFNFLGIIVYQTTPVQIMSGVRAISAGEDRSTAIGTDNRMYVWGKTDLMWEDKTVTTNTVLKPMQYGENMAASSIGSTHVMYLRQDGSIVIMGDNSLGQIPTLLPDILTGEDNVVAVGLAGLQVKLPGEIKFNGPAPSIPTVPDTPATPDTPTAPDTPATPDTPAAPDGISVTVDGTAVTWTDAEPFIDANSRTMVPLRAVADAMGLDVNWDGSAREAVFTDGGKTIYFPIDSNTARTSDGGAVQMDTAAVIVNERTYAPIRYLAEYFGYEVGWDAATRTVTIK